MVRKATQFFAGFGLLTLLILCAQYTQQNALAETATDKPAALTAKKKAAAPKMSTAQKIALAVSAGPAAVTKKAAIFDMVDMSDGKPKQLRAGTNGWACYASIGQPMCLDKEWQKWAEAWMNKSELKVNGTGFAYMLRGDKGASNTDPYATEPTADNQWVVSPAHIMVLFPDPKTLEAYPTDPKNGGPWVMWKGTPYAHVMVPVSPTKAAMMSSK
jgi:hypothetical protein